MSLFEWCRTISVFKCWVSPFIRYLSLYQVTYRHFRGTMPSPVIPLLRFSTFSFHPVLHPYIHISLLFRHPSIQCFPPPLFPSPPPLLIHSSVIPSGTLSLIPLFLHFLHPPNIHSYNTFIRHHIIPSFLVAFFFPSLPLPIYKSLPPFLQAFMHPYSSLFPSHYCPGLAFTSVSSHVLSSLPLFISPSLPLSTSFSLSFLHCFHLLSTPFAHHISIFFSDALVFFNFVLSLLSLQIFPPF